MLKCLSKIPILLISLSSIFYFITSAYALTTVPLATHHGMSSVTYQTKFDDYSDKGYRLIHVDGYNVNGTTRFAAMWEKKSGGAWVSFHNMSSSTYRNKFDYYVKTKGYRLIHVDGYTVGNKARFAAIWEKASGPAWRAKHNLTRSKLNSVAQEYGAQGYRLYRLSGYVSGGITKYAAIWHKVPANSKYHTFLSSKEYQSTYEHYATKGYKIIYLNAFNDASGTPRFAAIWRKATGDYSARHNMTHDNYQSEFENFYYQGLRLKCITGYQSNNKAKYAAFWINRGMARSNLNKIDKIVREPKEMKDAPAIALAITKDERLVYAKAWGYKDDAKNIKISPRHLFRIASLSKMITGASILKLIEDDTTGQRELSTEVFENIFGKKYGSLPTTMKPVADYKITVDCLLEHVAGGWGRNTGIMAKKSVLSSADHIKWVLSNSSWANDSKDSIYELIKPGVNYSYSNFSYNLLGRVIEEWSGESYQDYVKNKILAPLGITKMIVSRTDCTNTGCTQILPSNHVQHMPKARYNYERMDSHGGWSSSPIEFVRFLVSIDGRNNKKNMLVNTNLMYQSDHPGSYAKGISPNCLSSTSGGKGCHSGTLKSLRTFSWAVVNNYDGFSYAIFMHRNKATSSGEDPNKKLRAVMEKILSTIDIKDWPGYDLF
jgi:CubicO group peptidase (beta-lactamase class C family)